MSYGRGVPHIFGFRKATTWGTAIDVDAASGTALRPIAWGVKETAKELPDESYNASRVRRQSTLTGDRMVELSFAVELCYENHDFLQAWAFGSSATTGTNPYTHRLQPAADATGIFATASWYDGIYYQEIDSLKCKTAKYTFKPAQRVRLDITAMGRKRAEGGVNANLNSLSEGSNVDYLQWLASIATFQTVTQAGTLADFDANELTVEFTNNPESDGRIRTLMTAPYFREPAMGRFETKVDITFPYEASTYRTGMLAGTTYELKAVLALAAAKTFGLYLPSLTYNSGDPDLVDMAGMPLKMTARSDKALSTPTSFNSTTAYVESINTVLSDPLA